MRKTIFALLCFAIAATGVKAQDMNVYLDHISHQKSIQLNFGTQGVGAEFASGLTPNLAIRAGVNFIPVTMNNAVPISGLQSETKLTASFSNIHLLADFTPFTRAPFFRLVGGAAYFVQAKGGFEIQPTGTYTYGDIVLTQDQVGKVNMNADWSGIAPYVGFGLIKVFPKNRFNVNLDLGSYYLNRPQTTIIGTGLLDGNSSQNGQFQQNISSYRFLPVLQLNFNFKL